MATSTTNTILTQIALKRLSGKALTSGKQSLPQEPFGSTVQSSATTIFGEVVPNTANTTVSDLYLIQSASVDSPGTIQLVEFDLIPLANGKYQNVVDADDDTEEAGYNQDTGVTTVDTFHAYMLRLTGSYETDVNDIGSTYFADNASTSKILGTDPEFSNNFIASGSVQFQVVPEYLSTEVGSSNPYLPVVIASDGSSEIPFTDSSRNMYFDAFSGILFVQDPVDYGTATDGVTGFDEKDSAATIPAKLRAFLYVGKYQSEVVSGDIVDLHISASEGGGFSLTNASTASFESGSAGITVTATPGSSKITIGDATDDVTFNNGSFTGNVTVQGDIIAENYIISSSVTYMTQSFSSGSTIFGDTVGGANPDTHQFTGSIFVTGSTFTWNGLGSSTNITPLVIDSSGNITTGSAYATSASLALLSASFENVSESFAIVSESFATVSSSVSTNTDNITELQASSSAGIFFSGSGGGFSIPLTDTASFSASGAGLTVNVASDEVEYIINPNTLIEAVDTATIINITASYAASASQLFVNDNEANFQNLPILFAESPGTGYVKVSSDGSTFNYNPGLGRLTIGQSGSFTQISSNQFGATGSTIGFKFFDDSTDVETVRFAAPTSAPAGTINLIIGTSSGEFTTYISGTLTLNLKEIDESAGTFNILNISSSSERTPLVIDDSGKVTKADADFAIDIVASGSQILTVTSSDDFFGVVFTKRVQSELTGSGDLQEHVPQGSTGLVFTPSRTQLRLQNQIPETVNNNNLLTLEPGGILSSGSETFSVLTGATGPSTINVGVGNGTVFFQGSASIAGDLIVQGTTTTLNTENLLVEDRYILLGSSSADNNVGGGIIVQKATSGVGTALHWDDASETWAVDIEEANASTATAKGVDAKIAFISSSAGLPGASFNGPVIVGSNEDYKKGQFYVDTTDEYGLYVYL